MDNSVRIPTPILSEFPSRSRSISEDSSDFIDKMNRLVSAKPQSKVTSPNNSFVFWHQYMDVFPLTHEFIRAIWWSQSQKMLTQSIVGDMKTDEGLTHCMNDVTFISVGELQDIRLVTKSMKTILGTVRDKPADTRELEKRNPSAQAQTVL